MKTFEECKQEVAKKQGWTNLVSGHLVKYFDEAAEMYADQFKEKPTKWEGIIPILERIKDLEAEIDYQNTHSDFGEQVIVELTAEQEKELQEQIRYDFNVEKAVIEMLKKIREDKWWTLIVEDTIKWCSEFEQGTLSIEYTDEQMFHKYFKP